MADVNYDAANGHTNGYAANGNSNTLMQSMFDSPSCEKTRL
jgi:hypothetical protein